MKARVYFLVLLISIFGIFAGCNKDTNESKKPEDTNLTTESSSPKPESSSPKSEISPIGDMKTQNINKTISLGSSEFNLDMEFNDVSLKSLDKKNLSVLRNALYAKYGYIFSTKEFTDYFSKITWYTPILKNVDEKLNDVDRKNISKIVALEENTQKIKNSSEDKDWNRNGEVDIPLNGKTYKLNVISEDIKTTSDASNNATRITMKIGDSKIVYEDLWNGGIVVKVADFDNTDGNIDIYLIHSGTDVQCQTIIYKFDGNKMFEYDRFKHILPYFLYDEKGSIYYTDITEGSEINKYYNYKSRKSGDIVDNNQKVKLTKLWKW